MPRDKPSETVRPPRGRPLLKHEQELARVLDDLFPLGLTDDCPVRRELLETAHAS